MAAGEAPFFFFWKIIYSLMATVAGSRGYGRRGNSLFLWVIQLQENCGKIITERPRSHHPKKHPTFSEAEVTHIILMYLPESSSVGL